MRESRLTRHPSAGPRGRPVLAAAALGGLFGLQIAGCDGDATQGQTSSSSHWVSCDSFEDCSIVRSAGAVACEDGYCVNAAGDPVPRPSAGTGGEPGATGGSEGSGGSSTPAGGASGGSSSTAGGQGGSSAGAGGAPLDPAGAGGDAAAGAPAEAGSGGTPVSSGGASSGSAGQSVTGGSGGSGGTGCECVKGAYVPVCGVDGQTYDAACGLDCVPVEVSCEGECPCDSGAGGAPACAGDLGEYVRPDLDKSCTTADDCFVGQHWRDCCGSQIALGYNVAVELDFDLYELPCRPACACPSQLTIAEDGSPLEGGQTAVVECVEGLCMARSPETAGTCLGDEECIDVDQAGSCVVALGPVESGVCRRPDGICYACDCASPDTPIATPQGERPIADLRVGDLVYSVDDEAIRAVPLRRIRRTPVVDHVVVEAMLASGRTLRISAVHPTADGNTFADLHAGGELDGTRVLSARRVPYMHAFTHDILPDSSSGSYYAAGVLIGSTLAGQTSRNSSRPPAVPAEREPDSE